MDHKKLGHYDVLDKIGAGGMGEVYRANDPKLGRDVALKILPAEMTRDPERRKRFEREARAIAALQHPNIVTIYSVDEADDVHFLAMELVEGDTLSDVIPAGGLTLERFFDIAIPLADAIGTAHERGITHRDLKPANIMFDRDGRVKVLDFGLAKLIAAESSDDQAATVVEQSDTQAGRILGTAAYMSPEQAEGKPVDHRSDIFSLGILFYEMATGKRPFVGETTISTITSILRDSPPALHDVREDLPRHLGRIVRRCLQKDPSRRYQSALDLRNDLEEFRREIDSGELDAATEWPSSSGDKAAEPPRGKMAAGVRGRSPWVWVAAVACLVAVVSLVFALRPRGAGEVAGPTASAGKTGAPILTFTQVTEQGGVERYPRLSPDANFVVYDAPGADGSGDIFLQRVGGRKPINLTAGAVEDDMHPAYSPDGQRIAFRSDRQGGGVFVMGATGESVRRVTDFGFHPDWSPDGKTLAICEEGINTPLGRNMTSRAWTVDVATGDVTLVSEGDAVQPRWSPGGERIAFWKVEEKTGGQRDIWTMRADGEDAKPVTQDAHVDWCPVWGDGGKMLYFVSDRGGTMNLWRVPIDAESGETLGPPEPVTTPSLWVGAFDVSPDGRRIAFASEMLTLNIMRIAYDPARKEVTGLPSAVTKGSVTATDPDVSRDGQWVTFRSYGHQEDIYLARSDGSEMRKLTDDLHRDRGPSFSPDGEHIAFYSDRGGRYEIWTIRRDGSGLEQLTTTTGEALWFPMWSPDGRRMVFYNEIGTHIAELNTRPILSESATTLPRLDDGSIFGGMHWSPDGRQIAGIVSDSTATRQLSEVVVYNLDTRRYRRIPVVSSPFNETSWFDNERIIFRGQNTAIYQIDLESGEVTQILRETPGFECDVSSSDSMIFFTTGINEGDIWLANLQ